MIKKVICSHLLGGLVKTIQRRCIIACTAGSKFGGKPSTVLASDSYLAQNNCAVASSVSRFNILRSSV